MQRRALVLIILLSPGLCRAHAQATVAASPAKHKTTRQTQVPRQTSDKVLIEQLNDKYDRLQRQLDQLQQRLSERDTELQQAKDAAVAAQAAAMQANARAERAEEAMGTNNRQVSTLQSAVAELKGVSATLTNSVAATEKIVKTEVDNPDTIRFKGITLKPGGFLVAETVWRKRGIGGDINTQFTGIPFTGSAAGMLSEFNASGRQSRISLLAEGKLSHATLRGYYEADFLSSGVTSNDNQSNSYTLRQRQVWAQADLNSRWTFTGGQMWSLATENKSGLRNAGEFAPLTIDAQYNAGFSWARQYGFRVVRKVGPKIWTGVSAEEAQTLNIGGHNLPPLLYQQAGNSGGLYTPTANYSYNRGPDLVAKIVVEPGVGHYELFGLGRFFRDQIYPDVCWSASSVSPITQTSCAKYTTFPTLVTATGVYNSKTEGGGVGANAWVTLPGHLDVAAHLLVGDGVGRYGSSTLADVTAHPDGSLEPLRAASALARLEWHPSLRWDIYGYYGGDYVAREYYLNPAGTLTGYGLPTNVTSGCNTIVAPTTSANGGGNVPGSATSCTVDNRNIQEGTVGYWYRFYRGNRGSLTQGFQYSYIVRNTWIGVGGAPKAIDNMWFTSFRYHLPQ
jgi:hypothetical protein